MSDNHPYLTPRSVFPAARKRGWIRNYNMNFSNSSTTAYNVTRAAGHSCACQGAVDLGLLFHRGFEIGEGAAEVAPGGLDAFVPEQVADVAQAGAVALSALCECIAQPMRCDFGYAAQAAEVFDGALDGAGGDALFSVRAFK